MKKISSKIKGKKELEFIYTISSNSSFPGIEKFESASSDADKVLEEAKNYLEKRFRELIEWESEDNQSRGNLTDGMRNYIGCTFAININLHKIKAI